MDEIYDIQRLYTISFFRKADFIKMQKEIKRQ